MKNKILVYVFIIFILSFSMLGIVMPDKEISNTEKRKLDKFPKFELSSDWISDLDSYLLDHFVFRDFFRSIKAKFNYNVLNKLDNNGIYLKDNYIFKSNYPTNKESINKFKDNIKETISYLNSKNHIYFMIVPDKNYYLDSSDFLKIDYEYIYNEISDLSLTMIDIRNILSLDDYYQTDTHWKQEKLDKVIKKMSNVMKFDYQEIDYKWKNFDKFYGVYYGESAIIRSPEQLIYLDSILFDGITLRYLENSKLNSIYNESKLEGLDAYDVYLDGASSYIKIENPNAKSNRELVIFRDSFGSSLSPLLVNYYKNITIIDNRYITSDNYKKLIKFTNQDVLFMYSTLLINDSKSLKG